MITQEKFNELLESEEILTAEKEFQVFEYYHNNKTIDNRNKIVLKNKNLVYKPARKYSEYGCDLEDLIQEGLLGIIHAIDKFKYTMGIKFSTYAYNWINAYLIRYTINNSLIFIPEKQIWKINRLKELTQEYEQKYDRQPSKTYLCQRLGIDETELSILRQFEIRDSFSMDIQLNDDSSDTLYDIIEDTNQDIDKVLNNIVINKFIAQIKDILSYEEYNIFNWYYGMNGNLTHSIDEIANIFNTTNDKIRTRIKIINRKIKRLAINGKLEDVSF